MDREERAVRVLNGHDVHAADQGHRNQRCCQHLRRSLPTDETDEADERDEIHGPEDAGDLQLDGERQFRPDKGERHEEDSDQRCCAPDHGTKLGPKDLERDLAIELEVVREIHGRHPTLTELPLDSIAISENRVESRDWSHVRHESGPLMARVDRITHRGTFDSSSATQLNVTTLEVTR